jgi:hypothetical protein
MRLFLGLCLIIYTVKAGGDDTIHNMKLPWDEHDSNISTSFDHQRRHLTSLAHIRQGAFGVRGDTKNDVPRASSSWSSSSSSATATASSLSEDTLSSSPEQFGVGPGGCTINNCEGVNLVAAIRKDLEQWKLRGGITLADTDAAMRRGCAVGEEDGHFFGCVPVSVPAAIVVYSGGHNLYIHIILLIPP